MVSWLDRAIASVAPRTATRRVLARQAFEGLARSYEGAARGRRTDGWHAPGSSADTEIGRAGALLRDRMRDLVRNNPHAAKAVSVLVNNIVGAGIMPRAASGDAALDREVDRLFEIWARGCDADGQLDFYVRNSVINTRRSVVRLSALPTFPQQNAPHRARPGRGVGGAGGEARAPYPEKVSWR
jgi:capsid protein